MSKRDIYDQIVAEVEADKQLITMEQTSYADMVAKESLQLRLPKEGVFLKSDTSAFAEYAIRDALIVKALEDEEFTFVLVNKIGTTVKNKVESKSLTQNDIEAFATAGNLLTMWEQFGSADSITEALDSLVEEYSLTAPQLTTLTKRLLSASDSFPFPVVRQSTIKDLGAQAQAGLDNE